MKQLQLTLSAILFFFILNAQKNSNDLKIHGGAEITTGIFKEGYKTGWGIYATDYMGLDDKFSILVSAGLTGWKGENSDFNVGLFLPRAGLRVFPVNGFYVQGDAGIAILTGDWAGNNSFTYGGGVGYLIKNKSKGGIDVSARVNRFGYRTWIGLGFGYQFALKK